MISPDEAKRLLSQEEKSMISQDEAKRLLAQDSGGNETPMSLYPTPGLSSGQTSNMAKAALAGLLKFGQGVGELQAKGLRALGAPIRPLNQTMASNEATGINKLYSPKVASTPEGKAGFLLGSSIPYLTPASTSKASVELAPKVIPALTKELLKQAGILGLTGAISQPESSIGEAEKNTFTDPVALAALGISPAATGLGKLGSSAKRLYEMKGGTASPEEVLRRISAAGKTPVPLAEIIESPMLKGFQSSGLVNTPGSGMQKVYLQGEKSLQDRLSSVLNNLDKKNTADIQEEIPDDIQKDIADKLKAARVEARQKNQLLHTEFSNMADKAGILINPEEYTKTAKNELDELKDSQKANKELQPLEKGSRKQIKQVLGNISAGIPPKNFKNASLLRASLNDAIESADREGNNYHIRILSSLKKSLENDIEKSAIESGNPEIHQKYLEAKNDYAQNVAPFEEGVLAKFSKPMSKVDTDLLLQSFVKSGKVDRPNLLKKLTTHFPSEDIGQIAHETLMQRGNGILDPTLTAYGKLGNKVKNILFEHHPEEKKELDDILSTRKILGQDLHQMMSPKTGEKAAKLSAYAVIPSMIASIATGHPAGAALIGGGMVGANLLKRALMSDKWRQQYLKAASSKKMPAKLSRLPVLSYPVYLASQESGGQ